MKRPERSRSPRSAWLEPIELPPELADQAVEPEVRSGIVHAQQRIQAFQDRWERHSVEQFVASDYELVFQTLRWITEERLAPGRRMLEWGCGFAVVSALAARLGWDVVGIEAEATLLVEGRRTAAQWDQPIELVQGNFLPEGAEDWADDPTLPSLGHPVAPAYPQLGLELDDFDLVFAYPWPGEEEFLAEVFRRRGAAASLLLLFCGPYDLRLFRRSGRVPFGQNCG